MTKNEAAAAFHRIAEQLNKAGFTGGEITAAIRGDEGEYFLALLQYGSGAYEAAIAPKSLDDKADPFAAAFLEKPDAQVILLLAGDYAKKAANALRFLRAELDDMAQIVGLTARVALSLTPKEVKRCLRRRNSCFVRGLGMFITGRSQTEAVTGAILLEKAAMTHLLAQKIGGAKRVPLLSAVLMHQIYQKKYSRINLEEESAKQAEPAEAHASAEARSEREQLLREQIVTYGRRLSEEGLVQGTWGNIAVRLDETHMLVTPSGLDYRFLTADDVVRVELETLDYGAQRKPTSEKRLHRDVFAFRNGANACIHTHSRYCGVFAAARKPVCCISGEMQRLVGSEMCCAPHALPSTKKLSKVAIRALGRNNGCLLMNHGVLCCGSSLDEAYQTCKTAEQAAKEQLEG